MRLYLSRLLLNPWSPRVMADLLSAYDLHRTLAAAFAEPGPAPALPGRVLYRVYDDPRCGYPALLVQAPVPADWGALRDAAEYVLPLGPGGEPNPAQKPWLMVLERGEVFTFALRANPTRKQGRRRVGLTSPGEQMAWLAGQGETGGFEVLGGQVHPEGTLWTRKRQSGQNWDICLRGVTFRGWLRVTCPARLQTAVACGIGRGRAFGFGLLSLARPPGD
jgi:CRISPR system Cascade subunit CasE